MGGPRRACADDLLGDWQIDAENTVLIESNMTVSEEATDRTSERCVKKGTRPMGILWSRQRFLLPCHQDWQMNKPLWKSLLELGYEPPLMIENFRRRMVTDQCEALCGCREFLNSSTQGVKATRE